MISRGLEGKLMITFFKLGFMEAFKTKEWNASTIGRTIKDYH